MINSKLWTSEQGSKDQLVGFIGNISYKYYSLVNTTINLETLILDWKHISTWKRYFEFGNIGYNWKHHLKTGAKVTIYPETFMSKFMSIYYVYGNTAAVYVSTLFFSKFGLPSSNFQVLISKF